MTSHIFMTTCIYWQPVLVTTSVCKYGHSKINVLFSYFGGVTCTLFCPVFLCHAMYLELYLKSPACLLVPFWITIVPCLLTLFRESIWCIMYAISQRNYYSSVKQWKLQSHWQMGIKLVYTYPNNKEFSFFSNFFWQVDNISKIKVNHNWPNYKNVG